MTLFKSSLKRIRQHHKKRDYQYGWNFLSGPKSTLQENNGLVLLGLNPGGTKDADHVTESVEEGNAYHVQGWNQGKPNKLQKQVQALFKEIAAELEEPNWREVLDETVTANLVPFRSPRSSGLKKDAIAFGQALWVDLIKTIAPSVILTIGNGNPSAYRSLVAGFISDKARRKEFRMKLSTKSRIKVCYLPVNRTTPCLIGLPHLSWSPFGTSKNYRPQRKQVVQLLAAHLT